MPAASPRGRAGEGPRVNRPRCPAPSATASAGTCCFWVATAALWAGMSIPAVLGIITRADLVVLRAIAIVHSPVAHPPDAGRQHPDVTVGGAQAAWATIVVLAGFHRFRHLASYLIVFLASGLLVSAMMLELGRMRPGRRRDPRARGRGTPSRRDPVAMLALALVGTLYMLVPAGRWRNRGKWAVAAILGTVCAARLYLAVDHPTDVATALILGWPLPVVVFWLAVPNEAFPVSYWGRRKAHLDIGGQRGEAIVSALDRQLGLAVTGVAPFGLEASAGSTPLRLDVQAFTAPPMAARSHAVRQALRGQPPQVRPLVQAGQDGRLRAPGGREAVLHGAAIGRSTKTTCSG